MIQNECIENCELEDCNEFHDMDGNSECDNGNNEVEFSVDELDEVMAIDEIEDDLDFLDEFCEQEYAENDLNL